MMGGDRGARLAVRVCKFVRSSPLQARPGGEWARYWKSTMTAISRETFTLVSRETAGVRFSTRFSNCLHSTPKMSTNPWLDSRRAGAVRLNECLARPALRGMGCGLIAAGGCFK